MPGQFMGRGMGGLMSSGGVSGNGLLNNLVAYWPLNEAAGANDALDLHTNALHLTQVDSPGSAAGKVYAGARVFNTGKFFTRASHAALVTGDVDFTISAWVYLTTKSNYNHILAKGSITGAEYLLRYQGGAMDKYYFEISYTASGYANATASNFGVPPTDTWTFIVVWHDSVANQIGISVNDGTPNTTSHSAGVRALTSEFNIGAQVTAGTLPWIGRIGPVAMWKSAAGGGGCLSAAKIAALYNAGNGLPYAAFTA
jgi:hypothetical protein